MHCQDLPFNPIDCRECFAVPKKNGASHAGNIGVGFFFGQHPLDFLEFFWVLFEAFQARTALDEDRLRRTELLVVQTDVNVESVVFALLHHPFQKFVKSTGKLKSAVLSMFLFGSVSLHYFAPQNVVFDFFLTYSIKWEIIECETLHYYTNIPDLGFLVYGFASEYSSFENLGSVLVYKIKEWAVAVNLAEISDFGFDNGFVRVQIGNTDILQCKQALKFCGVL